MNPKIKAVIFDFDGLLVNTEELRLRSFHRLLKKHGKKFRSEDYILTTRSVSPMNTTSFLKDKYQLADDLEQLHEERMQIFGDLFASELVLLKGARELLKRLDRMSIKRAIASGRRRSYITQALDRFALADYFSVIVSPEDLMISDGKPHPEVYLITAEKLGVIPKNCVALEDAPHGIEAAKAAGMKAIYIPDERFGSTYHEQADLILKGMHELTDEVLGKLIHG